MRVLLIISCVLFMFWDSIRLLLAYNKGKTNEMIFYVGMMVFNFFAMYLLMK